MADLNEQTPTNSDELLDELGLQFKKDYRASKKHQGDWHKEAKEAYQLVAGCHWTDEERAEAKDLEKRLVTFNRTDPVISAVVGHQINNRQEVKYIPRNQGDAQPNEILSGAAKYVDDESDALDEITDAFWDLSVCGMGWTETHIEYDEDPEGKVYGADRISPLEMGWDGKATKRNLADARFVYRERWWPRNEAKARWPKLEGVALPTEGNHGWLTDAEGTIVDDAKDDYGSRDAGNWYDQARDCVLICQYQYYKLEPTYMVGDPMTNRLIELSENKFKKLKPRIDAMGARYVRQMRRKYYQAWMLGGQALESGECPCPHSFTLRCMTGKRDEIRNYWYGLVKAMQDPQRWSNKVFSDITSIMYANRTGGAFYEESAITDVRKAEDQWAQESPLIQVADGALSNGRIMERSPQPYPAGLDRLMEFAVQSIPHVTGLSMELMGLVDRNQPGVLEMQRKRAGMTILAVIFDSLKRYGRERARVLKYFIEEYISDGRLIRIVGGDGLEKFVPLMKDKQVMKYDIVVSEAPTSPNQKEETFLVLRELVPTMAKMGVTPPKDMIDYLPLPAMLIESWKKQIMAAEQNPMTQRIQELEIAEREAEVGKLKANANKDNTQATLNQVKALVEKMQLDLEQRLAPIEQMSKMLERSQPKPGRTSK